MMCAAARAPLLHIGILSAANTCAHRLSVVTPSFASRRLTVDLGLLSFCAGSRAPTPFVNTLQPLAFALRGRALALVGELLSFVGHLLAVVRDSVTLVGHPVSSTGLKLASSEIGLALGEIHFALIELVSATVRLRGRLHTVLGGHSSP